MLVYIENLLICLMLMINLFVVLCYFVKCYEGIMLIGVFVVYCEFESGEFVVLLIVYLLFDFVKVCLFVKVWWLFGVVVDMLLNCLLYDMMMFVGVVMCWGLIGKWLCVVKCVC